VRQTVDPAALRRFPMFASLTPEQLDAVAERMHERFVPAGTDIITREDPGDTVFLILEGSVKVYRTQAEGGEVMLEPMNAADRKVVHDTVAEIDGVRSFSEGEEPRRSVVIAAEE